MDVIAAAGFILRQQGRWREAAQRLEDAMFLDPRAAARISDLGLTYEFMREHEKAEDSYSRALSINRDDLPPICLPQLDRSASRG